ncbi:flavin reductase family protein [Roseicitreum antarcticum]|uniref:NADH-FMN oxidoreductase RutF, flavin reductase (DIM6/NTAB) family n=1 Tax=Roseicitreum antarcticum TaxID=564137 RepID=A0A1H2YPE1_9RHOB|nr:flavin reductase family protein [Roseicitreum antarcticum]SDX07037.1 NADH-FMN oxidoreductase RutF, flavin reductase (DIM6/NTAB) family [Roseicitreum antarcticum]
MTAQSDTLPALSQAFRDAFRCHPAGVAVITADPGDNPVAMTVSSLISVSADPPTVAFSLSARSGAAAAVLAAETMVIHLMRYGDLDLALLGATPGADRFGGAVPWARLPTGEPRYTNVATWFRARNTGTLAVPGASVVTAELLDGDCGTPPGAPELESLIYLDRRWHRLRETADGAASLTPMDADYRDVFR